MHAFIAKHLLQRLHWLHKLELRFTRKKMVYAISNKVQQNIMIQQQDT
jgi:hypothetical protein